VRLPALALVVALGCGPRADADAGGSDSGGEALDAAIGEDSTRDVVSTDLAVDVTTRRATARVTVAPSASRAISLEIGDLAIHGVRSGGTALLFADRGARLDVAVPATTAPIEIEIDYTFSFHPFFTGADAAGWTVTWPYHCGNLFPCRSDPADGTTFALALGGVPAGMVAVHPATIPTEAPAYQIAWAIGAYVRTDLGTTTAGTRISAWHRAEEDAAARAGAAHLRDAFEWLETTRGP
jgi:aminopeptidase N